MAPRGWRSNNRFRQSAPFHRDLRPRLAERLRNILAHIQPLLDLDGVAITLAYLSTHTSGLPRLPDNFKPKDPTNPYADYTVDQLYQFLNGYTLTRDPGAQFEYSNLGAGLLGRALSLRAGTDYETLVRRRITEPLGMKSTAITLTQDMQNRLAVGHNAALEPANNWDFPTLSGAGMLRSTANDMLTLLSAELNYTDTPLKASMARQLSIRRPAAGANMQIALGWLVRSGPSGTVIWHNGGTNGYSSFIGFDAATRKGVVVLSNTSTVAGVDDIGFHLLIGTPLAQPPRAHAEIALDSGIKQGFAGRYRLAPNFILTVSLEGDQLYVQATGQPKVPFFPETSTQLFCKVADIQLSFTMGTDSKAASVILHQNGHDTPGERVN